MQHDWIKSTLGHGDTMCRRCFVTNLEAAALGIQNICDVPTKPAPAANENDPPSEIDEEAFVDEDDEAYQDCGRWNNGHLTRQCRLAGSELCDWECPLSR